MTDNQQFEPYSRPNPRGESNKTYFGIKVIIINIAILIAVAYTAYRFIDDFPLKDNLLFTSMFLFMISAGFVVAGLMNPMSAYGRSSGGGYEPSMTPEKANLVAEMMTENMKNGLRRSMYSFPATIITFVIAMLIRFM